MKLSSLLLAGDVGDIMYEELLPENVPLFGGLFGDRFMVNPSFRTAFFLTLVVLVFSLIFRFIIFPRFKKVPGTFQALIEKACEAVEGVAKENSPASYGFTDTLGRMHGDAQFAGSSSVPAHVEMMGFLGMGNNPMVGATVAVAVSIEEAMK